MLICAITIGNLPVFNYADEVEITSTWRNLLDTCSITLPRKIANGYWNQSGVRLDTVVTRGMPVTVQLGYGGHTLPAGGSGDVDTYTTVFNGYVSGVHPGIPVKIDCEDNMFVLKNTSVAPKVFANNPTLNQILAYCGLSNYFPYQTLGVTTIGNFVIDRSMGTILRVLHELKEKYHIYSFLRTINGVDTVIVGQPYDASGNAPVQILEFGQNLVDYGTLKYMDANDIKIELQAVAKKYDGSELTVTIGDSGGDHFTWYTQQDTLDAAALKAMAQRRIAYYKYTGYRGDVNAYGLPTLHHGDIASLIDPDWKDRNGEYFLDEVKTKWGKEGFRQHGKLGPLASVVYQFGTSAQA